MATSLYAGFKRGIVNFPGITSASKEVARQLLSKDAAEHHCYFRSAGLHNHVSHHLLALYDLGGSPGLLKRAYEDEASYQRPIFIDEKDKGIFVTQENWAQHLGNQGAYGSFVTFFENSVNKNGMSKTLEQYLLGSDANTENASMLVRLVSGALHPFIQVGYGLEFGLDALVVTGLAQAAIHKLDVAAKHYPFSSSIKATEPSAGSSLWNIYREMYDSKILAPVMPYDSNALVSARIKAAMKDGRPEEISRLTSTLSFEKGDEDIERYTREITWLAVLLTFGTSKPNRKIRLDFFLMHLVTSSIFLPSFFKAMNGMKAEYKANLIRAYVPSMLLYTIIRGRPKINPELIMSFNDVPRPPKSAYSVDETSIGSPERDDEYNPWPALIEGSLYAPDSHTVKTMRALVHAAVQYGDTPKGEVVDKGLLEATGALDGLDNVAVLDGSIFVRCAGVLLDYMGWTTHGQEARSDWDRSGLGWDAAWENEKEQ